MPETRLEKTRRSYSPELSLWLLEQQERYLAANKDPETQLDIFRQVVNRCAQAFIAIDRSGVILPAEDDACWPAWSYGVHKCQADLAHSST